MAYIFWDCIIVTEIRRGHFCRHKLLACCSDCRRGLEGILEVLREIQVNEGQVDELVHCEGDKKSWTMGREKTKQNILDILKAIGQSGERKAK